MATGRLHTHASSACLLFGLLGGFSRLGAQGAAERSSLQLFRDSLDFSRDTLRLHQVEAHGIDAARAHRDDAILHLRLGFVALRINELGGSARRVDDAISEFEWATQLQPEWPYPWFGLGLAEARMPDRIRGFAGGLWSMLGIDRDTRAGTAFARSIKADPQFVDGLIAFAQTAQSQRIGAPMVAALEALRLAQESPLGWNPDLLLERGRLERLAGDPDSARIAFRRAMLFGFNTSMAWLELARTLPLSADTLPAAAGQPLPVELAYFSGAASDVREVVAMYRRDLQPIADDSLLAQFDLTRGDARVAWLRRFWQRRADADLRRTGDVLSEHFRRWNYALHNFRLPPFKRSYRWGIEIYRSHDPELDDRGMVWLRQGAPTARIVWSGSRPRNQAIPTADIGPVTVRPGARTDGIPGPRQAAGSLIIDPPVGADPSFGNETWRYVRPEGDLVLHFAAQDDPDDYRLVESILDLDVAFDAMFERAGDLPGLAALLRGSPASHALLAQEERLQTRRSIAKATTTSSWLKTYPVTWPGHAQWFAAGIRNGQPLVHVVFAVDATILRRLSGNRASGMVPVAVRAAFLDDKDVILARLDSVQMLRRPGPGAALVAARADLVVPPGTHHVRFSVEANSTIGATYPLDTLTVPDVRAGKLALSSILLGISGHALPWMSAPSDTVWLAGDNTFSAGDTLAVFLEAYGLRTSATYTMHLGLTRQRSALVRLLRGRRETVTLSERLRFAAGVGEIRRAISLAGLQPGVYQLEAVFEGDGSKVTQRRTVLILNDSRH